MYLFGKHTNDLADLDLKRLLENNIRENKTLEYKREFSLAEDKDKNRQEFLCDITSFYNSDGGCIIYGMEEKKDEKQKNTGYPDKFFSQQVDNKDKLEQQIHDVIRSNSDPSIVNIAVRFVSVDNVSIIVIGIPKRIGLPSMVAINGINKFFRRNAVGKYAVDVYELNQMFMQNQTIKENAELFRKGRIEEIMNGSFYPGLRMDGGFLLHAIPLNYQMEHLIDLSQVDMNRMETTVFPIPVQFDGFNFGYSYGYNYDGFWTFRHRKTLEEIYAYNQFFRNGIIEFFTLDFYRTEERSSRKCLFGMEMIRACLNCIQQAIQFWRYFQIEPPFFVSIYFNAPDATLLTINNAYVDRLSKSETYLPLIYIDKFEISNGEIYDLLRPYFNIIWQSAGKSSAPTKEEFYRQR